MTFLPGTTWPVRWTVCFSSFLVFIIFGIEFFSTSKNGNDIRYLNRHQFLLVLRGHTDRSWLDSTDLCETTRTMIDGRIDGQKTWITNPSFLLILHRCISSYCNTDLVFSYHRCYYTVNMYIIITHCEPCPHWHLMPLSITFRKSLLMSYLITISVIHKIHRETAP